MWWWRSWHQGSSHSTKHPLAYFGEKLSGPNLNYYTYDKEFDAIIQALTYWNHCLKPKPFVAHSDHKALSYINKQAMVNSRHTKYVEFLKTFSFIYKHTDDKQM